MHPAVPDRAGEDFRMAGKRLEKDEERAVEGLSLGHG